MALLWFKQDGAERYELRQAGRSLRLYTNGVFHSQYNTAHPVAGGIWDLLLLPAFALPEGRPRRVLLLGVGGGAVVRQLNHFLSPDLIVGVELNPVHLTLARDFFHVEARNVCLLEADARYWLEAYQGPAFDLVIDDLFSDTDGEPQRAFPADRAWCQQLRRVLAPGGVLVMNFDSKPGLYQAAAIKEQTLQSQWADAQVFTTRHYANHIGAFFLNPPDWLAFERRLHAHPELDNRRSGCRLSFARHPVKLSGRRARSL